MARPVVGNPFDGQIGTVAPTARAVDTYKRGVVKKSPFEALSNTLSNLEKKAIPALQREQARRAEAEYAAGVELYNENRVAIGQAVKDGVIAEGESPYLRKGYRISHINSMSARYADELQNALISKKLYTNGNPAAIEAFTDKFYGEFQSKNGMDEYRDVEIAEFFSPQAAKANETFRASWKAKHISWQAAANYAAWSNEVSTYTATLFNDDDTPEIREQKQVQLGQWLSGKVAQADVDGMNRAKVSQAIVDSVIMSAYENDDLEMLDILDNVVTGTGPMSGSLATRKAMYEAEGKIATNLAKQQKAAADKLQADNKRTMEQVTGTVVANALKDRNSSDEETRINAQKIITGALTDLTRLSQQGVVGAAAKLQTLTKFIDYNETARIDQIPDTRTAETFGKASREIRGITEYTDVLDYLIEQKIAGTITESDETKLLTQWEKYVVNTEDARLAIGDSSSMVSSVRKQFINSLGFERDGGFFTAETEALASAARLSFDDAFIVAAGEWANTNGRQPNVLEQREIAKVVMAEENLIFQSSNVAGDLQEQLETNKREREELALTAAGLAVSTGSGDGVPVTPEETLTAIRGGSK